MRAYGNGRRNRRCTPVGACVLPHRPIGHASRNGRHLLGLSFEAAINIDGGFLLSRTTA